MGSGFDGRTRPLTFLGLSIGRHRFFLKMKFKSYFILCVPSFTEFYLVFGTVPFIVATKKKMNFFSFFIFFLDIRKSKKERNRGGVVCGWGRPL